MDLVPTSFKQFHLPTAHHAFGYASARQVLQTPSPDSPAVDIWPLTACQRDGVLEHPRRSERLEFDVGAVIGGLCSDRVLHTLFHSRQCRLFIVP